MFITALTLTLAASWAPAQASNQGAYILQVDHLHTGNGPVLSPGKVLVRDGVIAEVGDAVSAKDVPILELHGHLSAGMIALGDTTILGQEGADATRFVLPEAESRFGFDPHTPALRRLCEQGITTVVLTPPSDALVAGRGLVAKTGSGRMLAKGQAMHVAFDAGMFEDTPDPTPGGMSGGGFFQFFGPNGSVTPNGYKSSYPGAARLLEDAVQTKGSQMSQLVGGGIRAWLRSDSRAETSRALAFAMRHKVQGTIEAGARVGELATQIQASGLGVALTVFRETNPIHATRSAVELAKAGVPFGFCLEARDRNAATLRLSAALCRRAGLSASNAWKALTFGAAQAVGLDGEIGTIAPGKDADFVLWDGDPNELTSRIERVWVDGKQVVQNTQTSQGGKQ
ncbi:MAG TPA: amidohydrolase family protein [Planctomycetota bacterium]|nr:amidohydrolase family protein [Planctomycetota bacterium]